MTNPEPLDGRQVLAIARAICRLENKPHHEANSRLEHVRSGCGASFRGGQLVVWLSPENHEQALVLWEEPASGDYLTPSEFYALWEEMRNYSPKERV